MANRARIIVAVLLALIGAMTMLANPLRQTAEADKSGVIRLDPDGTRGPVTFSHKNHESRVNPDPRAVFKTKQGASCSGCHHTTDKGTGVVQLWRCSACHRGGGDARNPKSAGFDELWSKTAFHMLCIECHRASAKHGPLKCDECHAARLDSSAN
jgi:hypothetical protein